jgi:hypothetical protein
MECSTNTSCVQLFGLVANSKPEEVYMIKSLFFTMSLFLTVSAAAAQYCENGTFDQMGDSHFSLTIHEDKIEVNPYESGFTVNKVNIVRKGSTIMVANAKVDYWSEGTLSRYMVDMIINAQPSMVSTSKMNVAISYGKGPFETYEMDCLLR